MKFITLEIIIIMNIQQFEPFPELDPTWLKLAEDYNRKIHKPEQPIPLRGGGFCPQVTRVETASIWDDAKFYFNDPKYSSLPVSRYYHMHVVKLWYITYLQHIYHLIEEIGKVNQRAAPLVKKTVSLAEEAEQQRASLLTKQTLMQSEYAKRETFLTSKEKAVVDAKIKKEQLQLAVDSLKEKIIAHQRAYTRSEEEKASLARLSIANLTKIAGLEEKKSSLLEQIENQRRDTEKKEQEIFAASVESQQPISKNLEGIHNLLLSFQLQNGKKHESTS